MDWFVLFRMSYIGYKFCYKSRIFYIYPQHAFSCGQLRWYMINPDMVRRILRWETAGFLFLIFLSWMDELLSLPHLLFNAPLGLNYPEAMLETVALAGVWLMVFVGTKRLAPARDSIKVCIWCRRVSSGAEWFHTEEYFHNRFDVVAVRCACPICSKKWEAYGDSNAARPF
jgi:hypothetical protein